MEQNVAKRVPYGIQDFVQVIEQNCYYVDKTAYIPKLEDCPTISSAFALAVLVRAYS